VLAQSHLRGMVLLLPFTMKHAPFQGFFAGHDPVRSMPSIAKISISDAGHDGYDGCGGKLALDGAALGQATWLARSCATQRDS